MNYLQQILKQILSEARKTRATETDVIDAIKKRYEVWINYTADEEGTGRGKRLVQPVAYGLSKSGNPVIRAFQPMGDSKTKSPGWKLFRLDKITSWQTLPKRHFPEPPLTQYMVNGKFNPNGDGSMSEVYVIADFEGSKTRYEKGGLKKYNELRKQQKKGEDPYADLRKNIEKSVMATPEVMKRIEMSRQPKRDWSLWDKQEEPNQTSAEQMKAVKDFGNNNNTTTLNPVVKTNSTTQEPTTTQQQKQNIDVNNNNYNQISKNGPVLKNNIKTTPEENLDNNEENNSEE